MSGPRALFAIYVVLIAVGLAAAILIGASGR
jgi:hypothetical protein